MSEFSELLSLYMKRNNVSMVDIAAYCGLERTTVYKFAHGTRTPSSYATVKKIADYLRLSYFERKTFHDKYMITVLGPRIFERRKKAEAFIRLFSSGYSRQFAPEKSRIQDIEELPKGKQILRGTSSILNLIHQELLREARCGERLARVVYDPLDKALVHIFMNVLSTNPDLRFEHVIGFYNESVSQLSEGKNLEALSNIIPMCMINLNYNCCYEYRNYFGKDAFPFFQAFIATSHAVIVFDDEFTNAAVFYEDEFIRFFQEQFEFIGKRCFPLFIRNENMLLHDRNKESAFLESIQGETIKYRLYPFLFAMLDEAMLRKYLDGNNLDEDAIEWIVSYIQRLREILNVHRPLVIMALDEVKEFMETGIMEMAPTLSELVVDKKDRVKLLDKLIKAYGTMTIKVFRKDKKSAVSDLSMWVTRNSVKMFFKTTHDVFYVSFEEPGLVDTFRDYLGNMDPWLFYDEKEALSILKKLREEYAGK